MIFYLHVRYVDVKPRKEQFEVLSFADQFLSHSGKEFLRCGGAYNYPWNTGNLHEQAYAHSLHECRKFYNTA